MMVRTIFSNNNNPFAKDNRIVISEIYRSENNFIIKNLLKNSFAYTSSLSIKLFSRFTISLKNIRVSWTFIYNKIEIFDI